MLVVTQQAHRCSNEVWPAHFPGGGHAWHRGRTGDTDGEGGDQGQRLHPE